MDNTYPIGAESYIANHDAILLFQFIPLIDKNSELIDMVDAHFITNPSEINITSNHKTLLMVLFEISKDGPTILKMAQILIKHKININVKDDGNNTALHYAIDNLYKHQSHLLIELLINSGVDLNIINDYGYTALDTAFDIQNALHENIIKLLIRNNAKLNHYNKTDCVVLKVTNLKTIIDMEEKYNELKIKYNILKNKLKYHPDSQFVQSIKEHFDEIKHSKNNF